MNVLKPRTPVPQLSTSSLDGQWELNPSASTNFTMLVFYRGLHCPVCLKYLSSLDGLIDKFSDLGVDVVALSGDDQDRAQKTIEKAKLESLTLAYGVSKDQAQQWGLHRSKGKGKTSIGIEEPEEFSEPGIFIIKPDGTLYWSTVSTMPFARPNFEEILGALKWVIDNDYPARGELS